MQCDLRSIAPSFPGHAKLPRVLFLFSLRAIGSQSDLAGNAKDGHLFQASNNQLARGPPSPLPKENRWSTNFLVRSPHALTVAGGACQPIVLTRTVSCLRTHRSATCLKWDLPRIAGHCGVFPFFGSKEANRGSWVSSGDAVLLEHQWSFTQESEDGPWVQIAEKCRILVLRSAVDPLRGARAD